MSGIEQIREMLQAATPRPWKQDQQFLRGIDDSWGRPVTTCEKVERGMDDAALIVELVNAADSLLEVAEAAREYKRQVEAPTARDEDEYRAWDQAMTQATIVLEAALARLDAHPEKPA